MRSESMQRSIVVLLTVLAGLLAVLVAALFPPFWLVIQVVGAVLVVSVVTAVFLRAIAFCFPGVMVRLYAFLGRFLKHG